MTEKNKAIQELSQNVADMMKNGEALMFLRMEDKLKICKVKFETIETISDCNFLKELNGSEKNLPHKVTDKELRKIIKKLGVPANLKGYGYIVEALSIGIKDMEVFNSITKILYVKIAEKFNTTPSRVERSIRHAIEVAWERGSQEVQDKIFGYSVSAERGKPTNSEFLAIIADYIRIKNQSL